MSMQIHSTAASVVALAGILFAGLLRAQTPTAAQAKAAAAAANAEAEAAEFEALLAHLIAPLQPELVRAAVRHPRAKDAGAARELLMHLTVHGGAAAIEGLVALAGHSEVEVRVAALRGIATLGFRGAEVTAGLRTALWDSEAEVRCAAIAALGAVGEADDVANLIVLMRSEEERVPGDALGALFALTSVRNGKDAQTWSYWWSLARKDLEERVGASIGVLAAGGTEVEVADARCLLRSSAWVAPRKFEEAAREWLAAEEPRLRCEAYRLIADARLADLTSEVAQRLRDETEREVVQTGRECLVVLGILPQPVVPVSDSQAAAAPPPGGGR
jgi:HEAT repeat protein